MSNKQIGILVGAIILILLLLLSTIFTIRKVPDNKWIKDYKFESKEPYGGWMFDQMVNALFDSNKVVYHHQDTLVTQVDSSDVLYISLSDRDRLRSDEKQDLRDFIAKGNHAVLITKYTGFEVDTIFDRLISNYASINDTTLVMQFSDGDSSYQYSNYYKDFEKPFFDDFSYLDIGPDVNPIATFQDTLSAFVHIPHGHGAFYFHSVPEMFSNHASKQDFYLDHFNNVFDRFNPSMVILDHPSLNPDNANKKFWDQNAADLESPIQFVLAHSALRWAYYLTLLGALIYITFRGKRRQKVIPLTPRNENTSLEYVETLSHLFMSQNQNSKLVPHLKEIFFQKVKSRYFLDRSHQEFSKVLSRKSRIEEKEINVILNMFDNSDQHFEFSDDQLIHLHRRLDLFYKNWI